MARTKYIFVVGGVASSLGKGIISASLAKLLQSRGFSVAIQKLDTEEANKILKTFEEFKEMNKEMDEEEKDQGKRII